MIEELNKQTQKVVQMSDPVRSIDNFPGNLESTVRNQKIVAGLAVGAIALAIIGLIVLAEFHPRLHISAKAAENIELYATTVGALALTMAFAGLYWKHKQQKAVKEAMIYHGEIEPQVNQAFSMGNHQLENIRDGAASALDRDLQEQQPLIDEQVTPGGERPVEYFNNLFLQPSSKTEKCLWVAIGVMVLAGIAMAALMHTNFKGNDFFERRLLKLPNMTVTPAKIYLFVLSLCPALIFAASVRTTINADKMITIIDRLANEDKARFAPKAPVTDAQQPLPSLDDNDEQ